MESGFGNIIVVDNLPVVPIEKFEKLENVIRKIYSQLGVIREDGFFMPLEPETQKTMGYCFIEFNTPQVLCLCELETVYIIDLTRHSDNRLIYKAFLVKL